MEAKIAYDHTNKRPRPSDFEVEELIIKRPRIYDNLTALEAALELGMSVTKHLMWKEFTLSHQILKILVDSKDVLQEESSDHFWTSGRQYKILYDSDIEEWWTGNVTLLLRYRGAAYFVILENSFEDFLGVKPYHFKYSLGLFRTDDINPGEVWTPTPESGWRRSRTV